MQLTIQKKNHKYLLFLFALVQVSYAQSYTEKIKEGDFLFSQKQYTQSLQVYEQVMTQTGQASPGMLLKMAFIEEGLDNYTKALYYLNLYYLKVPKQQIILKMKELAERHNLRGYEFGDLDFFITLYNQYYVYLAAIFLVASSLLVVVIIRKKVRRVEIPIRHGIGCILFLLSGLAFLNMNFYRDKAIVVNDYTYIMNAPSSGAKLIRVIRKGHRIPVHGQQDIWVKTEWNNQPAYIRSQNVLLIK
jgi:hypothetical protein